MRVWGDSMSGASAMGTVPLHIQKRFEQRWTSRFGQTPAAVRAPKNAGAPATVNRASLFRKQKAKERPAGVTGGFQAAGV